MKIITTLFISILFSLGLVEVGLRVVNFKGLSTFTAPCIQKTDIPGLTAELTPNCKQINQGVEMSINSCGFRGSEDECALLHTTSSLIYVVGDSYTNAGNISQEETFVKVAEKHLDGTAILNLGVAAASIDQKIIATKYFLDYFPARPTVVVLQWLLNDYDASINVNESRGLKTKIQIVLRKYLYTYRLLAYMKQRLFPPENIPSTFADVLKYRKNEWSEETSFNALDTRLCNFSSYLSNRGITSVFLNPPLQEMLTDWDDYKQMEKVDTRINEIAKSCGWQVIWPVPELKTFKIEDLVLDPKGDHHPNRLGNRIIGDLLGKNLINYFK